MPAPFRSALSALLVVASLGIVAAPTPAYADVDSVGIVAPAMTLRITYDPAGRWQQVCGTGALRSTSTPPATNPTWRMTTTALESGLPVTVLDAPGPVVGNSFGYCFTVQKNGAAAGAYLTSLVYDGTGNDHRSAIVAVGLWSLGQDNKVEVSQ
jgi:hypothetical protein